MMIVKNAQRGHSHIAINSTAHQHAAKEPETGFVFATTLKPFRHLQDGKHTALLVVGVRTSSVPVQDCIQDQIATLDVDDVIHGYSLGWL